MLVLILVLILFLLTPKIVLAFGPGVHLELALDLLAKNLPSLKGVAGLAFLYGNIVPDYFVSSATLKALFHTEEAFKRLSRKAANDLERAFALGFGAHLAADQIAHEELIPAFKRRVDLPGKVIHYYFEWTLERNRAPFWFVLRGLLLWPGHRKLDFFLAETLALEPRRFMTRKWVSLTSYRIFKIKRRLSPTNLSLLFERRYQASKNRCLDKISAFLGLGPGEKICAWWEQGP